MTMMRTIMRSFLLLLVAALLSVGMNLLNSPSAFAQTSGAEKPVSGATPGGTNSGSASDAELWRQIRKGAPGTVVGGDKSSGLMIQSGGQDWRLMRNGPLPKYAAWAILGTLLLLALFFALRGRIKIDHGPSGHTMKRFSGIERAGHWLLASSFIVLALTGLNLLFGRALLIPLLGKEFFSSITVFGKFIHNYVAFAFMLGLVMIAVMWLLHNIPNRHDVVWLLRGGGLFGSGHPPAKKFNAGQKIIFWVVILCGVSISMSGWALMNPFTTGMFSSTFELSNSWFGTNYATDLAPIQEQQYQSLWHTIMAVIMIAVILAHIYIGSVGMEGALAAVTSGDVDTNWAREHHSLWVDEMGDAVPAMTGISSSSHAASSVVAPAAASGAHAALKMPRVEMAGTLAPLPAKASGSGDSLKSSASANAGEPAADAMRKPPLQPVPVPKKASKTNEPLKAKPKSKTVTAAKGKPVKAKPAKAAAKPSTSKPAPGRVSKPKPIAKKVTPKKTANKTGANARSRSKDDLKRIKGIGPQNERRLNRIGVRQFADVAKWNKKEQAEIGSRLAFPGRIEREEWVKQAKVLAKESAKN